MDFFDQYDNEESIKRERRKARELRESQWWKRKIAKGVCHWCENTVSPDELTMDHIVPISRGGKSSKGNVVPSCKTCNSKKKYFLPMEWENKLTKITKE
jgi:5-methylcytosine-specific restriction endonuclease McrA